MQFVMQPEADWILLSQQMKYRKKYTEKQCSVLFAVNMAVHEYLLMPKVKVVQMFLKHIQVCINLLSDRLSD
jgi:hypothetical protein